MSTKTGRSQQQGPDGLVASPRGWNGELENTIAYLAIPIAISDKFAVIFARKIGKELHLMELKSPFLFGGYNGGQKITRARKKHKCDLCKTVIEPKVRYVLVIPEEFSGDRYGYLCVKCAGPEAEELAKEKRYK